MDSGKEYITEKDESAAHFISRATPKKAFEINYVSVDEEEKIYINGAHISSVEVIEDSAKYGEDDEIVIY